MNGWRVMATVDADTFLRDHVKLFMAYKDENGISAVAPLVLEMTVPVPDTTDVTQISIPPTSIPRELAEQIFTQLGYLLLGVSDPIVEIQRLRRELIRANERVDNLINGIGRLGGKNAN